MSDYIMMLQTKRRQRKIQVKVCGLTSPRDAEACVDEGADAIGLVFFPKSPRFVTDERASEISAALSDRTTIVGVFVNASFETIMTKVSRCGLGAVQLHGQELPDLIARLRRKKLAVIKAVFANGHPSLSAVSNYAPSAFLAECGMGKLPGGNAGAWNWQVLSSLSFDCPIMLAGGLDPANVHQAIEAAQADAVDVSSGVETTPGTKDMRKVKDFIDAVAGSRHRQNIRRIFLHA